MLKSYTTFPNKLRLGVLSLQGNRLFFFQTWKGIRPELGFKSWSEMLQSWLHWPFFSVEPACGSWIYAVSGFRTLKSFCSICSWAVKRVAPVMKKKGMLWKIENLRECRFETFWRCHTFWHQIFSNSDLRSHSFRFLLELESLDVCNPSSDIGNVRRVWCKHLTSNETI